ncbi:MAG TPA: TadE family protein [Oceanobacillus sp.]|nr:TadE family protein [Oceanobacillus sp.]
MRKLLAKIIQILDGTPAEYGKRQAGQALVETAAVVPLLLILLSGMVEIGWFANNYLTLLDVTRAGARRAATLSASSSPLAWDNKASYLPIEALSAEFQAQRVGYMAYSGDPRGDQDIIENAIADREEYQRTIHHVTDGLRYSGTGEGCRIFHFYNDVACTMVNTLEPLLMNPKNGVDDIIISAFSIEAVDPADIGETGDVRMMVVGRYPTNANECDAVETAPGSNTFTASMDPRDPFDLNGNNFIDRYIDDYDPSIDPLFISNPVFSEIYPGYDVNQINLELREKQVGFSFIGQHRVVLTEPDGRQRQTLCLGSEWSIADVEAMLNLSSYADTPERRRMLEGTGLVLTEIYWRHEMLLKLPVFNPVYGMFSPDGEPPTIYVWAAFPLPSVAPNIVFH